MFAVDLDNFNSQLNENVLLLGLFLNAFFLLKLASQKHRIKVKTIFARVYHTYHA